MCYEGLLSVLKSVGAGPEYEFEGEENLPPGPWPGNQFYMRKIRSNNCVCRARYFCLRAVASAESESESVTGCCDFCSAEPEAVGRPVTTSRMKKGERQGLVMTDLK